MRIAIEIDLSGDAFQACDGTSWSIGAISDAIEKARRAVIDHHFELGDQTNIQDHNGNTCGFVRTKKGTIPDAQYRK